MLLLFCELIPETMIYLYVSMSWVGLDLGHELYWVIQTTISQGQTLSMPTIGGHELQYRICTWSLLLLVWHVLVFQVFGICFSYRVCHGYCDVALVKVLEDCDEKHGSKNGHPKFQANQAAYCLYVVSLKSNYLYSRCT